MIRPRCFLSLMCLVGLELLLFPRNSTAQTLTSTEAKQHMGEMATVCGKVVGARLSKYAVSTRGRPTFLDLDKAEPNPDFLIVAWGAQGAKPEALGNTYQGKQVCVTGRIIKSRGVPQIIATKASQIKILPDQQK